MVDKLARMPDERGTPMKDFFCILAIHAGTVTGIVAAAACAIHRVPGWGWFLFIAAICTGGTYKSGSTDIKSS